MHSSSAQTNGQSTPQFGRFFCQEKLKGREPFEIFRARSQGLAGFDRAFVVKTLSNMATGAFLHPEAEARLVEAAGWISTVRDPRVARVVDFGSTAAGSPWVASEYHHGAALTLWLRLVHGPRSERPTNHPALLAHVGAEIAEALAAAHAQSPRVMHGSLQPSNVFLSPRGQVKVVDFALRQAVLAPQISDNPTVGYRYRAPENRDGSTPAQSADVFALGCLLFEIITGKRPPAISDPNTPSEISSALQYVSAPVRSVVQALLTVAPDDRPTAADAALGLKEAAAELSETELRSQLGAWVSALLKDGPAPIDCDAAASPHGGRTRKASATIESQAPHPEPTKAGQGRRKTAFYASMPTLERPAPSPADPPPLPSARLVPAQPPPVPQPHIGPPKASSEALGHPKSANSDHEPTVKRPLPLEDGAASPRTAETRGHAPIDAHNNAKAGAVQGRVFAPSRIPDEPDSWPAEAADGSWIEQIPPLPPATDEPGQQQIPEDLGLDAGGWFQAEDSTKQTAWASSQAHRSPSPTPKAKRLRSILLVAGSAAVAAAAGISYLGSTPGAQNADTRETETAAAEPTPSTSTEPPAHVATRTADTRAPTDNATAYSSKAEAQGGVVPGGSGASTAGLGAPATPRSPDVTATATAPISKTTQQASVARSQTPQTEAVRAVRTLEIRSSPPGAAIWINGGLRGHTPTQLPIRPRDKRLALIAEGYAPLRQPLDAASSTTKLHFELEPARLSSRRDRSVQVTCETAGRYPIALNGSPTGALCPAQLRLPRGIHEISVFVPWRFKSYAKRIRGSGAQSVHFPK